MIDRVAVTRRRAGAALLALAACGGSTDTDAGPADLTGFQVVPVDLALVDTINPLGHMTTPFNVLPQARIYFVLKDRTRTTPIRAPAGGTVSWMVGPKPDFRIEVQVSPTIKWYVDHVMPASGITTGSTIVAGQQFATHSGASCCVDFAIRPWSSSRTVGRCPCRT